MSRNGLLLIIGISLVACTAILGLQRMKRRPTPIAADGSAPTQAQRSPFRTAVVELEFRSHSQNNNGEEYLRATGHRTEYIDVTGGRRREDYVRNVTALGQLTSVETLTGIFDGASFYLVTEKDGKRAGHVLKMREGYDYTIWGDSAAEKLHVPGATVSDEEFLGRPCKVYSISPGKSVQKWWVWNGVTLRSVTHFEDEGGVQDASEEALRVEEDGNIDPSLFALPADVTFEPVKPTVAEQLDHHKSAPWVRLFPEINLWF